MGCDQRMTDPGETCQHFWSQFPEQVDHGVRCPQYRSGPTLVRDGEISGLNQVLKIQMGEIPVHCAKALSFPVMTFMLTREATRLASERWPKMGIFRRLQGRGFVLWGDAFTRKKLEALRFGFNVLEGSAADSGKGVSGGSVESARP